MRNQCSSVEEGQREREKGCGGGESIVYRMPDY